MENYVISIVGTGAVGGYYGGLLAKNGHDVTFLLHSDYDHVRQFGLTVNSVRGAFHLDSVKAASQITQLPKSDLIIVATKTIENKKIFPHLSSLLKPLGRILLLQNGLGMEDHLAEYVSPEKIMGGTCFICSHKTGPGVIHHLDYGLIKMGMYRKFVLEPETDFSPQKITDIFLKSGIQVMLSDDLILDRWKKLVWNIPYNGLSVVNQTSTDVLMQEPTIRTRVEKLMQEVQKMAEVCGYEIEALFIEKMLLDTEKMVAYKPSMMLDFLQGKPLELESMYATPIQRSREAGYDPLEVNRLFEELEVLNRKNKLSK